MVLATHQMQGSFVTFPSRPLSWSEGRVKQHLTTLHMVGKTYRHFSVKHNLRLSVGACVHGPKVRLLKISSFKGSAQNDESGGRTNGCKVSKNSIKLSYVPKEGGETTMDSPKVHSVPVSYTSEANQKIIGSPAIYKLFNKWLNMLRTQSPSQVVDAIVGEELPASEVLPQSQNAAQNDESGGTLKAIWFHFLRLDAAIKIPTLMFIAFYVAVNVLYGPAVSKELTPLWILGPLVVAIYIKMLCGLWALYVFSFKQTVKVIKNLPTYYLVASSYLAEGKVKEDLRAHILHPVVKVKNLDYTGLARKKMKELEEWFVEKYLDFVESIWPHYCRTIRFLKRANLI